MFVSKHKAFFARKAIGNVVSATTSDTTSDIIDVLSILVENVKILENRMDSLQKQIDTYTNHIEPFIILNAAKELNENQKKIIIEKFGTILKIRNTSIEELSRELEITKKLAHSIKMSLS
ncbi:MAG: hypothetical protein AAF502_19485 [Bacteroidota bacterium]